MASNALTILNGKNVPAGILARRQQRKADYSGIVGSGASTNRISLDKNRFSLRVAGETLYTHDSNELDVVIVAAAARIGRQWFAKGYDPKDTEKSPPACFSQDGQKPDPTSSQPQGSACKMCPKNQVGSGQGGRGKACQFVLRMAVETVGDADQRTFIVDAKGGTIFGGQDEGDSKFNLKSYLAALGLQDLETTEVYTRMSFDLSPDAQSKVLFTPIQLIDSDDERERLHDKGQSDEVKAMLRIGGNLPVAEETLVEDEPAPATRQLAAPKAAEPVEDAEDAPAAAPAVRPVSLGGKPAAAKPTKPKATQPVQRQVEIEDAEVVDTPQPAPAVRAIDLTGKPKVTAAPVQRTPARPPAVAQESEADAPAPVTAKAKSKPPAAKPAALRSDIDVGAIDDGLASLVADWEEAA